MICRFCNQYVNERRVTTFYSLIPGKPGKSMKKVRWCKACEETKFAEIEDFLDGKDYIIKGEDGQVNRSN